MMKLKGKVALVTGAGRGIGKAAAILLAKEGANVVVNDVDLQSAKETAGDIRSIGCEALPVEADISDKTEVVRMVETVIKNFTKIDILVNNAGIFSSVPLIDMTEDEWDKMMDVNLKGVFLCSQAAMKFMIKQRSGKIVNIASLAGKVGGIYAGAHYAASKAGVICLTKSLAKQLAQYNINVNAVAPALIETDMMKDWPKQIRESLLRQVPLGRFGAPDEVAETVLFLVSEGANYITGATIDVNGGLLMD
ncbi:MAG: SDR family oxidoreductase [Candidatus Bathyarchaeota archaeon]|nr:SDR family oxidoreductase [Candidatus Bathyarchaeota archaeon]